MSTIEEDGLSHEDYFRMRDGSPVLERHAAFLKKRFLPVVSGGWVLEVGCGAGFLLTHLREALAGSFSFVGSDVDRSMLLLSRRVPGTRGIRFVQNSDNDLPFRDRSFPLIVCDGTFHHFDHPEKMFSEMYRILTPGGQMIIMNIDAGFLFAKLFRIFYRVKRFLRLDHPFDFALYNSILHSPSRREMQDFLDRNPLGERSVFREYGPYSGKRPSFSHT